MKILYQNVISNVLCSQCVGLVCCVQKQIVYSYLLYWSKRGLWQLKFASVQFEQFLQDSTGLQKIVSYNYLIHIEFFLVPGLHVSIHTLTFYLWEAFRNQYLLSSSSSKLCIIQHACEYWYIVNLMHVAYFLDGKFYLNTGSVSTIYLVMSAYLSSLQLFL